MPYIYGNDGAIVGHCTPAPPKKIYKSNIEFEQAQSKDDWVSGYNSAIKQLADFSWMQTQISEHLAEKGVFSTQKNEYMKVPTPTPPPIEESPFNA